MLNSRANHALRAIARGAIVVGASLGAAALAQPSDQIDVSGKAGEINDVRTKIVRTSDLNLADPRGQQRLERRLNFAAAEVCEGWSNWVVHLPREYGRCFDDAFTTARVEAAQRLASGETTPIRVASR